MIEETPLPNATRLSNKQLKDATEYAHSNANPAKLIASIKTPTSVTGRPTDIAVASPVNFGSGELPPACVGAGTTVKEV